MKKSALYKSCRGLLIFALALPFAAGCAQKGGTASDTTALSSGPEIVEQPINVTWNFDDNDEEPGEAATSDVLKKAMAALGTPYVRGGTAPNEGFDCSGFVQWAYLNGSGIKLPRTAREQSVVGKPIKRTRDIKIGDIVAFWHPRRGYHTGIYVGDEKFIHSPRRRQVVKINSLNDPYFSGTFLGARRVGKNEEADSDRIEMNLRAYEATQGKMREIAMSMPEPKAAKATAQVKSKSKNADRAVAKAKSQKTEKLTAKADKADSKNRGKLVAKADVKSNEKTLAKGKSKTEEKSMAKAGKGSAKFMAQAGKKEMLKSADDSLIARNVSKNSKSAKDSHIKTKANNKKTKEGREHTGKKAAHKSETSRNT